MASSGYDVSLVEQPNVAVKIKCPICHLILRTPRETVCCNQYICKSCSEEYLNRGKIECLLCREKVNFREAPAHERVIKQLKVHCTRKDRGCKWQGELGELDNHLNVSPSANQISIGCGYTEIECPVCREHFERYDYFDQHKPDECPNEDTVCVHHNKGCEWKGQRKMLKDHLLSDQRYQGCEYVQFKCIHECGTLEERRKLRQHEEECQHKIFNNKFEKLMNDVESLNKSIKAIHTAGYGCIALILAILLGIYLQQNAIHMTAYISYPSSCADIIINNPGSPSGYYLVMTTSGKPDNVYCDMTRSCGGVTGGWMRVAYLNMSNDIHQCPSPLQLVTNSNVSACALSSQMGACSSVIYQTNSITYSKVCGKVLGGEILTCDGFGDRTDVSSIDSNYVDGVSLTHGNPQQHIWTFAANSSCPCGDAPQDVGDHYFCDGTADDDDFTNTIWDGENCDDECCTFNNPPWFYRQLSTNVNDDIEMRVCRDQPNGNEDVLVKVVEIYVQ